MIVLALWGWSDFCLFACLWCFCTPGNFGGSLRHFEYYSVRLWILLKSPEQVDFCFNRPSLDSPAPASFLSPSVVGVANVS